jgi:hypothetical protein
MRSLVTIIGMLTLFAATEAVPAAAQNLQATVGLQSADKGKQVWLFCRTNFGFIDKPEHE